MVESCQAVCPSNRGVPGPRAEGDEPGPAVQVLEDGHRCRAFLHSRGRVKDSAWELGGDVKIKERKGPPQKLHWTLPQGTGITPVTGQQSDFGQVACLSGQL